MSRTIRRTEKHLLKWWLPELQVAVTSSKDWRRKRLPGLLYSRYEPEIIRRLQSDQHRFFCGPGTFNRNRWYRKFRQYSKAEIRQGVLLDNWDDFVEPLIYYPYMW